MVSVEVGEEPVAVRQPGRQAVEAVHHEGRAGSEVPGLEGDWLCRRSARCIRVCVFLG